MVKKVNFLFWASFAYVVQVYAAQEGQTLSLGPVVLRMALSLGFVLVLAFVVIFMLRKFYGRSFSFTKQKTSIRVLSRHNLDAKNTLFVVEVEGKTLLLGSGGGNLNLICPISQETHLASSLEEKRLNPENTLWQEKVQSLKKALHA